MQRRADLALEKRGGVAHAHIAAKTAQSPKKVGITRHVEQPRRRARLLHDRELPLREAAGPDRRDKLARVRRGAHDPAQPGVVARSRELAPFEELYTNVAVRHNANEVDLHVRQNLVTKPEKRRPHLRMVALHEVVRELKGVQNCLRHVFTRPRRRHLVQELLGALLQSRQQSRRLHADRLRHRQVKALRSLRLRTVGVRQKLAVIAHAARVAEDDRVRFTARSQELRERAQSGAAERAAVAGIGTPPSLVRCRHACTCVTRLVRPATAPWRMFLPLREQASIATPAVRCVATCRLHPRRPATLTRT